MDIGRLARGKPVPYLRGLAAITIILAAPPLVTTGQSESPKLVVVVYPHESDGAPGIALLNHGIRSAFAGQPVGPVEVRNEYVDASRLRDAEFMRTQTAMLRQKYAGRKVDLVIAGLSLGLDFVLAVRDEAFPGVPIVHVLLERREVETRRLPPDVIGVPVRMDMAGTLDLALRLHPDTRRVFVVAGSSAFDTRWATQAEREFHPFAERVDVEHLIGLPMDDLLDRVANLPDRSLIYYLHVFRDGAGKDFIPGEIIEQLAARANAPVYTHVDTFVDRGAVGGHVYSHEAEGRAAARVGLRILSGETPQSIAVGREGESAYLFNARQLRRWGVAEASLPPGAEVRFREPTFWETYRWHLIGVVALCAVEGLLIAGLLASRANGRRSEAALRESEARFRLMADAAPILIWASGVDRAGTYFNRPWLEFTGRPLERELGDGWADGVHPDDLARCLEVYAAHFDARAPFEMVYRLRRHDGEYRRVLDRGVPRFTPSGEFAGYIGTCSDITELRRAEDGLLASQQELRLLTGRLLEAQEAERRRIARELHDDLNQGLALLSVELDLLGQRPPPTDEVASNMWALSARVKDLSAAVRDLSHQLHPSKLEHVGLVPAVRALCAEMAVHHGLEAKLTHRDVPEKMPEGTTLCLYRIVQEALRNIVKHGGTDQAAVELNGAAGEIRLRVSDEGVGFDPASVNGDGGLGLVSMRERLYLVAGRMAIDSRPGGGTRIDVSVPLPDPAERARWVFAPHGRGPDLMAAGAAGEESP